MNDYPSLKTFGSWLSDSTSLLRQSNIESPDLSARLILQSVTKLRMVEIIAHPEKLIDPDAQVVLEELLNRRLRHEPIAYLLGYKEFRHLNLKITPAVLIPRPETEELVDLVIMIGRSIVTPSREITILDVATGSGCIALSLASEFVDCRMVASDRSLAALRVALDNDTHHRVQWIQANWLEPFDDHCFDLVVSNPPYLTSGEMELLDPQVACYEPSVALDGGMDGCDAYRTLVPESKRVLKMNGYLVMEASPTTIPAIIDLMRTGFEPVQVVKDLSGKERFVVGKKSTYS